MKLNFWQWIGLILLIAGVVLLMRRNAADSAAEPTPIQQTR